MPSGSSVSERSRVTSAASDACGKPFVGELLGRSDYAIISEHRRAEEPSAGPGLRRRQLLEWLAENKGVDARGVEIVRARRCSAPSPAAYRSTRAISTRRWRIIPTRLRLRDPQPDAAGDAAAAEVLREMLRVGRRGHRRVSEFRPLVGAASTCAPGRRRRLSCFRTTWYDSPNIHFLTVHDFEALCEVEGLRVERRIFLWGQQTVGVYANLLAEVAVFQVARGSDDGAGAGA